MQARLQRQFWPSVVGLAKGGVLLSLGPNATSGRTTAITCAYFAPLDVGHLCLELHAYVGSARSMHVFAQRCAVEKVPRSEGISPHRRR